MIEQHTIQYWKCKKHAEHSEMTYYTCSCGIHSLCKPSIDEARMSAMGHVTATREIDRYRRGDVRKQ